MKDTGYSYEIEEVKIKEYMSLTTEEKLEWLDEIFSFTMMCLSDKEMKIREKIINE